MFNFLRNCQTVVHRCFIILYSPCNLWGVSISLHSHQYLSPFFSFGLFIIMAILVRINVFYCCFYLHFLNVQWCTLLLVFVFHLYILFRKKSIWVFCPFSKIRVLVILFLSCKNSLFIQDIKPLSDAWFAIVSSQMWVVFSHFWWCLRYKSFQS